MSGEAQPPTPAPVAEDVIADLNEVVFRTDAEGRWTYLNAAWERLTGLPADETLGQHFLDLVHPDEVDATVQMFMSVVMGGADFCHHETRYARADGSHVWVEVRASVLRDAEGAIVANAGTLLDISDRKRAETLLAARTRVLELVTLDRPLGEVLGAIAAMLAERVGSPASIMPFSTPGQAPLEEVRAGAEDDERAVFITAMPDGSVTRAPVPLAGSGSANATPIPGTEGREPLGIVIIHGDGAPPDSAITAVLERAVELAGLAIGRWQREAEVRHRALYDALTGLPNRYLIEDRLKRAMAESRRRGSDAAVLIVDIDRFKDVNDMLGHDVGDQVLQEVARRLGGALRAADTVGRLGGDEFVVVLPDISGAEDADQVAAKLQSALRASFEINGIGLAVSASVGISLFPHHGTDLATLLRSADAAMYRVKPTGGAAAVFEPHSDQVRASYVSRAAELRRAIDNGELMLDYQPQIDLRSPVTVGAEALVRWRHPTRGILPPDEFIGLAEQAGLMKLLTRWVIETALAETAAWRAAGATLTLAVNLSASMLRDPELVAIVVGAAGRWNLTKGQLELEVTESALLADPVAAIRVMDELDDAGISFALDDFGTGYSSLSQLKRVPARTLKIDRSFLHNLTTDPRDASIVQAVVHLGHDLGIAVVAEGVEDERTLQRVAELGCDQAQGFFLARPMPSGELASWTHPASP